MNSASIILAQGILESGGRGDLAVSANNHFESNVMKVKESVKHDDDSDQECFRKYNNHQNHLKITPLTGRPRYSKLFDFQKAIIRLGQRAANCRLCYRS
jgi:flagellum-specific peptidoglycan hydrolase FlgJ